MSDDERYAQRRAAEIARFVQAPPSLVARGFGRALAPASRALQVLVPVPVLQRVLEGGQQVSRWQFHQRLPQVQPGADLAECDRLARSVERVAMGLGGGLGAATGLAGGAGAAVDIPLILTLALATIDRTARCYGFGEDADADLNLGIFALASANTAQEKQEALRMLDADPRSLAYAAARDGLERAAQRQVAKDAAQLTLTQLARRISVHMGQRKAGQMVPVIGSLVGLSVNALYLRDISRSAQHVFALRYLLVSSTAALSRIVGHDPRSIRPPDASVLTAETAGSSASAAAGAAAIPEGIGRPENAPVGSPARESAHPRDYAASPRRDR
ncbi:MAG: EcsC family protein [Oceanococcaceae bacterium]